MNKLKTSLREVLLYIKYSKDKEKLKQVLWKNIKEMFCLLELMMKRKAGNIRAG